ncbi:pyridoxal phosphate-dependent transferase [Blastocladiella britannica]|nr:pyridoxal phosphate-dependent transferase [Blastocladiella britannica]
MSLRRLSTSAASAAATGLPWASSSSSSSSLWRRTATTTRYTMTISSFSTTATAHSGAPLSAPKPISDYTPYLTALSRARQPSAIRALLPLITQPGMLSFAGGMPNPATFPIARMSMTLTDGTVLDLDEASTREALQYGPTPGHSGLVTYLSALQDQVHGPAKDSVAHDRAVQLGNGSQDLLAKAIAAMVAPGDTLLVESPCYAGTLSILRPMARAMGVKLVEVPTDEQGLVPEKLAALLDKWPSTASATGEAAPRKPRVLYTVPTGGNPSGATAPLHRRHAVYEIMQKHDLVLLEDDPYYYLQFTPDLVTANAAATLSTPLDLAGARPYATHLLPSYLSMDTDGRVLRFESFSKIVSAGLRLGMATGPAPLIERIFLDTQSTSLQPTGPSQAMFLALARSVWQNKPDGFLAHAARVAAFYQTRRDRLVLALKPLVDKGLIEYYVPKAGMFLWIKIKGVTDTRALINAHAMQKKVLLLPGVEFLPNGGDCAYVRATYSTATDEEMDEGMLRFAECIVNATTTTTTSAQ